MDITTYVEGLRRDLTAAAAAGGADVEAAAERLALALDPAVRMVLLEALADAAAEISDELDGGSIDVRLKGREPRFVVTAPPSSPPPPTPPPPPGAPDAPAGSGGADDADDGPVARITLRMPESLKQRAEELAARRGQSLNTWLVAAARFVAFDGIDIDIDLGNTSFTKGARRGRPGRGLSGWAR